MFQLRDVLIIGHGIKCQLEVGQVAVKGFEDRPSKWF
jgi:hypothetical protein